MKEMMLVYIILCNDIIGLNIGDGDSNMRNKYCEPPVCTDCKMHLNGLRCYQVKIRDYLVNMCSEK